MKRWPKSLQVGAEHNLLQAMELIQEERESHVIADSAQVAQMVRDPLPLEEQRPQPMGPVGHNAPGQRFNSLAVGQAVGNGGIARYAGRQPRSFLPGQRLEPFFDALVHVPELLFEIDDVLSHGLEAEMAGLDDARMNRPDRDFVDPLAFGPYPAIFARDPRQLL